MIYMFLWMAADEKFMQYDIFDMLHLKLRMKLLRWKMKESKNNINMSENNINMSESIPCNILISL